MPMSPYLYWILAGFLLLIVEMTSGTFYLLVLGLAAFAAALAAWSGATVGAQAGIAGVVALAGVVVVWKMRAGDTPAVSGNALDVGGMVTLESWVDRSAGLAKVRYRDAQWEARVALEPGQPVPEPGTTLYIRNSAGNLLEVSATR
jgi:membrane protein implicated in regulation of membrane protease activity